MLIERSKVIETLKGVIFFAKGDNIVDLGMLDELDIKENKISFRLVFSKLGEPAVNIVSNAAIKALKEAFGEDTLVEITPITEKEKGRGPLAGVRNIIAVASGKGGVGKSTVAANLAVALSRSGSKVGLVDADIYGPSVPIMFGIVDESPGMIEKEGKQMIVPLEKYGIKLLSIGFFVDTDKPLVWRGPMATSALNQLLTDADWGILDYLIIDLPPGTGDIQLTLAQSYSITGAVVVTTPQKGTWQARAEKCTIKSNTGKKPCGRGTASPAASETPRLRPSTWSRLLNRSSETCERSPRQSRPSDASCVLCCWWYVAVSPSRCTALRRTPNCLSAPKRRPISRWPPNCASLL